MLILLHFLNTNVIWYIILRSVFGKRTVVKEEVIDDKEVKKKKKSHKIVKEVQKNHSSEGPKSDNELTQELPVTKPDEKVSIKFYLIDLDL